MEVKVVADEQCKSVALEYLKRVDRSENFFDLFDDHAGFYFPKWGIAVDRKQFEKLFTNLGSIIARFKCDMPWVNVVQQGDTVLVEGSSYGASKTGVEWCAGLAGPAGPVAARSVEE